MKVENDFANKEKSANLGHRRKWESLEFLNSGHNSTKARLFSCLIIISVVHARITDTTEMKIE